MSANSGVKLCEQIKKGYDLLAYMQSLGMRLISAGPGKYKCICEFHNDTDPSLHVSEKDGCHVWHCFGCKAGGTIIDFYALYNKKTLGTAIRELAANLGIVVAENDISSAIQAMQEIDIQSILSNPNADINTVDSIMLHFSEIGRGVASRVGQEVADWFFKTVDACAATGDINSLMEWKKRSMSSDFDHFVSDGFRKSNGSMEDVQGRLEDLRRTKKTCTACAMRSGCRQVVCCVGSATPSIMVIGEAPGSQEDEIGQPFVGDSGKALRSFLNYLAVDKRFCLISNVLGCRPQGNKFPFGDPLVKRCMSMWLEQEVEIAKPKCIVLLGKNAACSVTGEKDMRIAQARSTRWKVFGGIPAVVTYHPSYLIRQSGNPLQEALANKQPHVDFLNDFKVALEVASTGVTKG
jgi:uracil-DNA glycosylase family 4